MAQVLTRQNREIDTFEEIDTHSLGRDVLAGELAGQLAGLLMVTTTMAVFAIVLGTSPLFPVQVVGSLLYGDVAVTEGLHLGAFLTGLVLHQAGPSLFWGAVFGAGVHVTEARSLGALLLWGVVVGATSQVIDVNILLPMAYDTLQGRNILAEHVPVFWSWAAHMIYGLGLASFAGVYRAVPQA